MFSWWFEWYVHSILLPSCCFFYVVILTLYTFSKLVMFWPHSILFDNYLRIVVRIFITLFMEVSHRGFLKKTVVFGFQKTFLLICKHSFFKLSQVWLIHVSVEIRSSELFSLIFQVQWLMHFDAQSFMVLNFEVFPRYSSNMASVFSS